jgi:DNA-binding MarR family transcriptional regulator
MDDPAFLLAQIGAYCATRFASRLEALALTPAHAGVLRIIAASEGINQRDLAERLAILPARLVGLIDSLEERGLVERRVQRQDRRNHALHLTPAGFAMLAQLGRVARDHQADVLKGLGDDERAQLAALLRRLAAEHGLSRGVHPGFRSL